MNGKIFGYAMRMICHAVLFFVIWLVMCLIFRDEINWKQAILQAIFFGILYVPISDYLNKKQK